MVIRRRITLQSKAFLGYELISIVELNCRKSSGFSRGASMYRGVTRCNIGSL